MLRNLMASYNIAEYTAQTYAADMIHVIAGHATDVTQPAPFRVQCAKDVLDRAYGMVAQNASPPMALDPSSPEGVKVGLEIDRARKVAADLERLNQYANLPYDEWPEDVREINEAFSQQWADETGRLIQAEVVAVR